MAEAFSLETQDLIDAAGRAIAHSRELAAQRRDMMAECRRNRRAQEARFALRREMAEPK
jgi:hypothetical protein